ncbi:flagellar protein FlaG [Viridibacterium curvum]|uniref:Flagellar protein FlaG n=1 Tax=Viridibacterium curvum TaxID=1101404 RepID=A0ABP9QCV9_9RHOO
MAIPNIGQVSQALPKSGVAPAREVSSVARTNEEAATSQPAAPPAALSPEQIDRAMSEVRRMVSPVARNLQFSIDDETGRSVVKVVDATTNEVIRQIPSEELLQITRSLDRLSGLFVKQKA